jgi:deoxyribodipyrimidine photolyase
MKRIIHWFRRDLRISDNKSLYAACRDGDEVIPPYDREIEERIQKAALAKGIWVRFSKTR